MHTYRRLLAVVTLISSSLTVSSTYAAARCENPAAGIMSIQGAIEWKTDDAAHWLPVETNTVFCWGDTLTVRANSRAVVRLYEEQTNVQLSQGSTLVFTAPAQGFSLLELLKGAGHFISRTSHALKVKTPFVNASVEGTEFLIKVDEAQTLIAVSEGRVNASNEAGQLALRGGQSALAAAGAAPVFHTLVDPLEAVQWTLYYPPVFDFKPEDFIALPEAARSAVVASVNANRLGDLNTALALLEQDLSAMNDARFSLYRATLLLNVGRIEEAQQDIERALAVQPEQSEAWALRAVIAVTQNRNEPALNFATKAVSLAPNSAAARIALSYAYQARFNLDAALVAMQEAVRHEPGNALAWSRLAEVWLMHGKLDEALRAAQTATQLQPASPQAKTVLGFAHLLQGKPAAARSAFEDAIHLDQAAPLPRLGLGLVHIRQGQLATGRTQIEIATSLEPRNSLLRSYVGKAYYEEKRDKLAGEQFALAKELDPKDPTPWFYNALLLQAQNLPGAALGDLQKSVELNDNRAVYRSRLLLDDDLAARGASQARIYKALSFESLGQSLAAQSLSVDPSNAAAHRFLAESYLGKPRYENARASEFFQYDLLRPVRAEVLPPKISETNLASLNEGARFGAGFNEYSGLFSRDGARFTAQLLRGSDATQGHDVAVGGALANSALSMGKSYYETEGFREGAKIRHDLYNVFLQSNLTSTLSAQFEYRKRETTQGELVQNIDAEGDFNKVTQGLSQWSTRLGMHWILAPNQDIIFSAIHYDKGIDYSHTEPSSVNEEGDFEPSYINKQGDFEKGFDLQVQHLFHSKYLSTVSGVGRYNARVTSTRSTIFDSGNGPQYPSRDYTYRSEAHNVYAYGNFAPSPAWILTMGLASDSIEDSVLNIDQLSPKLGLRAHFTPQLQLRFAAFRTTKRRYSTNQTLEPTQIAGFNQFFDDYNGAEADVTGLGLDWSFSRVWIFGVEYSARSVTIPKPEYFRRQLFIATEQSELLHRVYAYWLPLRSMSVSASFDVERLKHDAPDGPLVRTKTLPLSISYFYASGLSLSARASYLRQHVAVYNYIDDSVGFKNQTFSVLDMVTTYRFAHQRGVLSMEINNLFDRAIHFQDLNRFNADVFNASPRYLPHRNVLIRATLNL